MHAIAESIRINRAVLGCTLFALALYGLTLAPTIGWGDSADLAIRTVYDADKTFKGGSRDYSFYRSVGQLFQLLPWGDAGTRANAMSAFFGAITVGLVAFISGTVARSSYAAWAAGIALAVSHTFWLMSVITEVYTFNAMLVFLAYALLIVWWRISKNVYLVAAIACVGLALRHHPSGLVLVVTMMPLLLLRIRHYSLKLIAVLLVVFIFTSFSYLQPVYENLQSGLPVLKSFGLLNPTNQNYVASPFHEVIKFLAYVAYNFLGLAVPLAVWGVVSIVRWRTIDLLPALLWLLLMAGAGITSSVPDKFNIYVLIYPVLAIAVGVGALQLRDRLKTPILSGALLASLALIPPLGYVVAVHGVQWLKIDLVQARTIPYRDNNWYFMVPSKYGDTGPRRYAQEALGAVGRNAILVADYSLWRPLYFMQSVEGMRPDVTLAWSEPLLWRGSMVQYIAGLPCNQPIFLAADSPAAYYQLSELQQHYAITAVGVVFRVERGCSVKNSH